MRSFALAILLASTPLFAQTKPYTGLTANVTSPHSVTLTWTWTDPSAGTVNVYRAQGTCSSNTGFTQVATGIAQNGPYVDSTITTGSWAYQVTAVIGGSESSPSGCWAGSVLPSPPSALTGTIR